MAANVPEIAAATLDHAERIRLLTEQTDRQRRSIARLGSAVGVLVVLQVLDVFIGAVDGGDVGWWPAMSRGMARVLVFGVVISAIAGSFWRRRTVP
jgi:hypothetical protein